MCGGIANFKCADGLVCDIAPVRHLSDAAGKCIKESSPQTRENLISKVGEICHERSVTGTHICGSGLICKENPNVSDVGGVCVVDEQFPPSSSLRLSSTTTQTSTTTQASTTTDSITSASTNSPTPSLPVPQNSTPTTAANSNSNSSFNLSPFKSISFFFSLIIALYFC
ncbi:hypothetical protein HK099_004617 [Clydaea vesicula]|uniref:Uncharacterized protein n=1 Tax=Clydaea vesicula TaxID=447962 RepID=A0AAD5U099_9FUNG|nr:hypothetical protein HK099_004617 [Clydaea vesicula]